MGEHGVSEQEKRLENTLRRSEKGEEDSPEKLGKEKEEEFQKKLREFERIEGFRRIGLDLQRTSGGMEWHKPKKKKRAEKDEEEGSF